MIYSDAKPVINGLQVTEVKVVNLPNTVGLNMDAVYALVEVDPRTKALRNTHGRCTASAFGWSERTAKLLKSLLESMEEDLVIKHFEVTDLERDSGNATGIESERNTKSEDVDQL